jgi:GxxExxY protein
LKTVDKLTGIHEAQLLHYLKVTGIQVGFLINFKSSTVEIKRLVYNLDEKTKAN